MKPSRVAACEERTLNGCGNTKLSPLEIDVRDLRGTDEYPNRRHKNSAWHKQIRWIEMLGIICLHRTRNDQRLICSCRRRVP